MENKKVSEKKDSWLKVLLSYTEGSGQRLGISVILPVISNNEVFHAYYTKKLNEGKGRICAQGHCIRKLLRVFYHLLSTEQPFNPELLV